MPIDNLPTETALVVIDLQRGVMGLETVPHSTDTVIANTSRLVEAFHETGRTVIFVRVSYGVDNVLQVTVPSDIPVNFSPPAGWDELDERLDVRPGDVVVVKPGASSFYGTDLEVQLSRRGITTLVVTGIATHMGGESTVRAANDRGYHQIVVSDAMASLTPELHDHPMTQIFPTMARIADTDEVVKAAHG